MKILVQTNQNLVTLNVEPSHTVGAVLLQALAAENLEHQPAGQQRLLHGDAVLDSNLTLADLGFEDGAELVLADAPQQTGTTGAAQAETSRVGAEALADPTALSPQSIGGIVDRQPADMCIGAAADPAAPPRPSKEPLAIGRMSDPKISPIPRAGWGWTEEELQTDAVSKLLESAAAAAAAAGGSAAAAATEDTDAG